MTIDALVENLWPLHSVIMALDKSIRMQLVLEFLCPFISAVAKSSLLSRITKTYQVVIMSYYYVCVQRGCKGTPPWLD